MISILILCSGVHIVQKAGTVFMVTTFVFNKEESTLEKENQCRKRYKKSHFYTEVSLPSENFTSWSAL